MEEEKTANVKLIPFTLITCDGGGHRRKDRPNGGLYVFKSDTSTCLATLSPRDIAICIFTWGEQCAHT